jgi:hypothetical protein
VLVLGVDTVHGVSNIVEDNDFYGVALVDYCAAVDGGDNDCELNPAIVQGMPEANVFEKNEYIDNGTNPDPDHPLASYAADFTYITPPFFDPEGDEPGEPHSGPYIANIVCGTPLSSYTRSGIVAGGAGVFFNDKC